MKHLALFTTVYPQAEPFLADWHRSVLDQDDRDFELWIASDGLTRRQVELATGNDLKAQWVQGEPGETPAAIRNRALALLAETAEAVVLVDSDDILLPGRIISARRGLAASELAGCALRLADAAGRDMGEGFASVTVAEAARALPRWNAFGFSNSAYRSDLLRRCLPVPKEAVLMDWLVATRAWLMGAELSFDPRPRMLYRRHEANIASALGPFSADRIAVEARLAAQHFDLLLAHPSPDWDRGRLCEVEAVQADVRRFCERAVGKPDMLRIYAHELERQSVPALWWTSVAYPPLSHLWT